MPECCVCDCSASVILYGVNRRPVGMYCGAHGHEAWEKLQAEENRAALGGDTAEPAPESEGDNG